MPSRRDRVRAATIEEIKATAIRMLREHGADLRFADIARDMGMTAPRYTATSPTATLLSALMVDGFQEMSDALPTVALDTAAPDDLAGRIRVCRFRLPRLRVGRPISFLVALRPPESRLREAQ